MKKILGTYDVINYYANEFRALEKFLHEISELYNFEYIKTPIIEETELFHRTSNNTKDIVNKHTYTFNDLSGKSITLRPECNSGVVRAVIENKLYNNLPRKMYYYGDVFRYDKPQKGRYREFSQFGYELIGSKEPIADAQMISLAHNIFELLGIKNIELLINSLGSVNDINKYRERLIEYFSKYIVSMCPDCKRRLIENPLRILNCNNEYDKAIIGSAPKLLDSISKESLIRFEKVLKYLELQNIPYIVDNKFVRGVDYQNDTIFEFINTDIKSTTQNSLCSGGRYDNLYYYLANKDIPAFGFDFGLERLISSVRDQNPTFFTEKNIDLFIINFSEEDLEFCFRLCEKFRKNGLLVDYCLDNRTFKSQLKFSDKYNPKFTLFIGEDERSTNKLTIRDNELNLSFKLTEEEIIEYIMGEKEKQKVRCLKK